MFVMDVPYMPVQEPPMVLAQATTSNSDGVTQRPDYILKECKETSSIGNPRSAVRAVDPAFMLKNYLDWNDKTRTHPVDLADIKPTLQEDTAHGKIVSGISNYGRTVYHYDPEPGYIGKDRAVFMAEFEGKLYKIVVDLVVLHGVDENPLTDDMEPLCPDEPEFIKVNKPDPASPGYELKSISLDVSALEGGALGEASGHTPQQDWSGQDSFSYRLVYGR